jgi:hypothetical protein
VLLLLLEHLRVRLLLTARAAAGGNLKPGRPLRCRLVVVCHLCFCWRVMRAAATRGWWWHEARILLLLLQHLLGIWGCQNAAPAALRLLALLLAARQHR